MDNINPTFPEDDGAAARGEQALDAWTRERRTNANLDQSLRDIATTLTSLSLVSQTLEQQLQTIDQLSERLVRISADLRQVRDAD